MSLNLCIDWGNTSIKAALFDNNMPLKKYVFNEKTIVNELTEILQAYKPVKAALCAVVQDTDEVVKLIKAKIPNMLIVTGRTNVPVHNAYLSQETLGPDRLALITAAYLEHPNNTNLVVSLGTCITYNLIQKNKTFRGGAISPGLQMRVKALHTFTDLLPEITALDEDPVLLGYDTDTCLQSGIVNGMAAEIDGMITGYERNYPDFNAILTGGDAPFFARKLKSKIFADPDILLRGLNLILNYNVPFPS